jgi:hypothetical protein
MGLDSDLPASLHDTLATAAFRRAAGEWDIALPGSGQPEPASRWLGPVLEHFTSAFPWCAFHAVDLHRDGERLAWDREQGAWTTWWRQRMAEPAPCNGVEATLVPSLAWVEDGRSGSARFPGAARLLVDAVGRSATFTLWINLHTDRIFVYERQLADGFDRREVPFLPAARVNRDALASSLRRWEDLAGATIESWSSELVDGIVHYGFADQAVAL